MLMTSNECSCIKSLPESKDTNVFQAVIDADLVPIVLQIMDHGDYKSQKEAVWVITNLTSGSSLSQVN